MDSFTLAILLIHSSSERALAEIEGGWCSGIGRGRFNEIHSIDGQTGQCTKISARGVQSPVALPSIS